MPSLGEKLVRTSSYQLKNKELLALVCRVDWEEVVMATYLPSEPGEP